MNDEQKNKLYDKEVTIKIGKENSNLYKEYKLVNELPKLFDDKKDVVIANHPTNPILELKNAYVRKGWFRDELKSDKILVAGEVLETKENGQALAIEGLEWRVSGPLFTIFGIAALIGIGYYIFKVNKEDEFDSYEE